MEIIYSQISVLEGELNSISYHNFDPEYGSIQETKMIQKALQFDRIHNKRKRTDLEVLGF